MIELKDYYAILHLEPSANKAEIKKAYRKLAQEFHPDKHNNDPYATARFNEIKEAYEILTDPAKKEYYHQQRWYAQSMGWKKKKQPLTPVTVLKQALELDRYVSTLDIHRMDKPGLLAYITELVTDEVIEKLNAFHDPVLNKEIVQVLLHAGGSLTLPQAVELQERLSRILAGDEIAPFFRNYVDRKKKEQYLERLRPWLVFVVVLLLSFLIWLMGR
jgi:hypothetical protein